MAPTWSSLLWFVFILALIPVALWLLKRSPLGVAASGASPVRVVGTLNVGPGQRILTLEVDEGEEKRWLIVGVSAQGMQTLHTLNVPAAQSPSGEPQR